MRSSNNYSSCGTDENSLGEVRHLPHGPTPDQTIDLIPSLGPRLCSQQSQSTKPVSQGVSHRVLLTPQMIRVVPKHSLNTEFWRVRVLC